MENQVLSQIPNGGSFRFGEVKFKVGSLSRTDENLIPCQIGKTNCWAYLASTSLVEVYKDDDYTPENDPNQSP